MLNRRTVLHSCAQSIAGVSLHGLVGRFPAQARTLPPSQRVQLSEGLNNSYDVLLVTDNDSRLPGPSGKPCAYLAHLKIQQPDIGAQLQSISYSLGETSGRFVQVSTNSLNQVIQVPGATAVRLDTKFSFGGKSAELSTLLLEPSTSGLLTFDDKTGIVYEVKINPAAQCAVPGGISNSRTPTGGDALLPVSTSVSLNQQLQQQADLRVLPCEWPGLATFQGLATSTGFVPVSNSSTVPPFHLTPRWLLGDQDGNGSAGFKAEWSCMKDGIVYCGSHGTRQIDPRSPCPNEGRSLTWIKTINPATGEVRHIDWSDMYDIVRNVLNVPASGYVAHEAVQWSEVHRKWFFLPRRVSYTAYSPETDAQAGASVLITCDEDGSNAKLVKIQGATSRERGYSSLRFLPGTNDQHIVALKTVETSDFDPFQTYISIFDINGQELLPETMISNSCKFEGLEVLTSTGACQAVAA